MGYKEWEEEKTEEVEIHGKMVTITRKVKQYQITCDFCGEVIVDTSKGIIGEGFVKEGDKYYHVDCYDAMKLSEVR